MTGTDLAGRVFVVTGAGNGIGRAVAEGLAERGGRVATVDLREDALRETAASAEEAGALSVHPCDATSREQVERLRGAVLVEQGQVDGLVNVASVNHRFVPPRGPLRPASPRAGRPPCSPVACRHSCPDQQGATPTKPDPSTKDDS